MVGNVSKETTTKELVSIDGVDDFQRRMTGFNMSAGGVNAIEACVTLFKAPTPNELLKAFEMELALKVMY